MAIKNASLTTTTESTIYSPASGTVAVLSIIFCNTTAAAIVLTVYAYPSGGSAGVANMIINSLTIEAKDTFIWEGGEKFILETGDKISGIIGTAVSGGITATVNYYAMA